MALVIYLYGRRPLRSPNLHYYVNFRPDITRAVQRKDATMSQPGNERLTKELDRAIGTPQVGSG